MFPRKKRSLFSADSISTNVHRHLTRDLAQQSQVYVGEQDLAFFREVQTSDFLKKFVGSEDQAHLEAEAYHKFELTNSNLGCLEIPDIDGKPKASDSKVTRALRRARNLCNLVLGHLDVEDWFLHCQNSSGSSVGVPYSDTSPERKMTYPISVTESCLPIFESYRAWDGNFSQAVDELNCSYIGDRYDIVEGSRATTVAKSKTARRMIAIEPTANMFLQQGLMHLMYDRLKSYGLDVQTLPYTHQRLAREASVTNYLSTIDFSSASDCVSTKLLEVILPPRWLDAVNRVRSETMEINSKSLRLNMISTMGNACTFPLETLIFWSLGCAAVAESEGMNPLGIIISRKLRDRVSVFGDDCILPTSAALDFKEISSAVGFIVNDEKSFCGNEGFRESCGGDYYHGRNVRPFHLKDPSSLSRSSLEPWLYVILNRAIPLYRNIWGDLSYVYHGQVFSFIAGLFREYDLKLKIVPPFFPDDSGLRDTGDLLVSWSVILLG